MNLSQLVMNGILNSNSKKMSGKIKEKLLLMLRGNILKVKDNIIEYNLEGEDLSMPFSHELPINRKIFPLYGENIGRITSYLTSKYTDLKMIDIGANVGDTVFIVKSYADAPMLCIEGDERFYDILTKNVSRWKNVITEKSFVGDKKSSKASYDFSKGTGRIVELSNMEQTINFENMEEILSKHSQFGNSKLLKIDTDGYDGRIIKSSLNYFAKIKPVIFFEYDPYLLKLLNDNGLSIFQELFQIGYNTALIYDNNGDYILSCGLDQKNILEDIHNYYSGRFMERYCDICVFHSEDNDIAIKSRELELNYYSNKRNFNL